MEEQKENLAIPEEGNMKQVDNKHYALIALALFAFFVIGIILYGMGVFKGDKDEKTAENSIANLAPPEAKNKETVEEKYQNSEDNSRNNTEENSTSGIENLRAITGKKPPEHLTSNENLTSEDFREVEMSAKSNNYRNERQRKNDQNSINQMRLQKESRRQRNIVNNDAPLYQKTNWEKKHDAEYTEEKEINRRTAKLLLDNMEKVQQQPQNAPTTKMSYAPAPTHTIKEEEIGRKTNTTSKQEIFPATEIIQNISKNTTGIPNKRLGYFYGLKNQGRNSYSREEGIPAVIHGQGEEIVVKSGSIVKLRILEDTKIKVQGGEVITLPAGSFIPATAKINSDRISLTVNNLRMDNAIYKLNLSVFDLDGQQGIYVPNLIDKNTLSQELVNAAGQPLSGTSIFANQGSIGTQVGTQMAMQASNSILSGTRSYVRSKIANPKVSIKPNYKIILKTSQANTKNDEENENN